MPYTNVILFISLVILATSVTFWRFSQIFFGNFAITNGINHMRVFFDLRLNELIPALGLIGLIFAIGIFEYHMHFIAYIIERLGAINIR